MADYLPVELLELIFRNLTNNLSDLHACRSVCSQWHRAATTIISSIPTPLLYLNDNGDQENANLVTRCCNKKYSSSVYRITFPDSLITEFHSASTTHKGWFFFSQPGKNVFAYNPLLRETIKLPQLSETYSPWEQVQFVTSSAPIQPNSTILAYYISASGFFRFEFCTPGDDNWTSVFVPDKRLNAIHDMIYYNGDFYAVNKDGFLIRFDLNVQGPHVVFMSAKIKNLSNRESIYLMESPCKELIAVTRDRDDYYLTDSISVYKMDWGRCNWEKMSSLGDGESIFLAQCDSMFIKKTTTDDDYYRSNGVYFYDDSWGGQKDCGFYDMKSGTVEFVIVPLFPRSTYRWFNLLV